MFYRFYLAYILFCFSVIGSDCPKITDPFSNLNDISAYKCINSFQNYEIDTLSGVCECQEKLPHSIPKRNFLSKEEKLNEIGSLLLSEVFKISNLVSELTYEISNSELLAYEEKLPESCSTAKFFSNESLSCNGKGIDTNMLKKVFGKIGSQMDEELIKNYNLKKNHSDSVVGLQQTVTSIMKYSIGSMKIPGSTNSCVPPEYQFRKTRLNKEQEDVNNFGVSQLLAGDIENLEAYGSDDFNRKKSAVNKAFKNLDKRCEKIKKDISNSICRDDLGQFDEVPSKEASLGFMDSIPKIPNDLNEMEANLGKINKLCEYHIANNNLKSKPLSTEIYENIKGNDFDLKVMSPNQYFSTTIEQPFFFSNLFSSSQSDDINQNATCSDICIDKGPYTGSECRFKDVELLSDQFKCEQSTDGKKLSARETDICTFVKVQRVKLAEKAVVDSLAHVKDEDLEEYINKNFEGEKRKKIASLVQVDRDVKSNRSMLDKFLNVASAAPVPVIAEARPSPKADSGSKNEKVQTTSTEARQEQSRNSVPDLPNSVTPARAQGQVMASESSEEQVGSGLSGNTQLGMGGLSMSGADKSRSKSAGTNADSNYDNRIKSLDSKAQRISDLMDKLDNTKKVAANNLAKFNDNKTGQVESSSRPSSSSSQNSNGNYASASGGSSSSVSAGVGGGASTANPNGVEYDIPPKKATDLVGRDVTGVSATEERRKTASSGSTPDSSAKVLGRAESSDKVSAISKLFMGEIKGHEVQSRSFDEEKLKRVEVPDKVAQIDLASLLKNRDEIQPGEAFILYEIKDGFRVDVTLIPTFSQIGRKKIFTGYRPLEIDSRNKSLISKLSAVKNLFKEE